jgi:lantibiotic modifying enzyme
VASQAIGPSTLSGGLVDVLAPVLAGVRARLVTDISQLLAGRKASPFDAAGAEALVFSLLPPRLAEIAGRTLAMELQLARLRGELGGPGPAEHLRDFVDRLCRRETALALFRQYPVLARQLAECVDAWAVAGLEFLRHLSQDWPEICTRFGADPGRLVGISAAGHRYRGGRCAITARFASGLCLAYQPRSLALDAHFQELLEWINQRSTDLEFRTLAVLDRGDHGWMEFVVAGPCASDAALSRLRRRQGG